MSGTFPKACVIALVVLGLLAMADLIPRMVIIATEARETSYWESWEEAYIDRESGKSAEKAAPLGATACMSQHCRCPFPISLLHVYMLASTSSALPAQLRLQK